MRLAILLACAVSLFGTGCADDFHASESSLSFADMSGSLRVPLSAAGHEGTSYVLRAAVFEVSGSAMVTLTERDRAAHGKNSLVTPLPSGEYTAFLRPGWRIVELRADGSEHELVADLLSVNPVRFSLGELGEEQLSLTFKSGDQELAFGAGQAVRLTSAEYAAANTHAL